MLYLILLFVVAAVATAFYFLSQPLRDLLVQNLFRQRERVGRDLEEMFILISVEKLQQIKLGVAGGLAVVALLLTWEAKPPFPMIVAGVAAVLGYWTPELVIMYMRRKRRAAFSEQLVDGLVLMGNGLRAGFTLQQAMDM